MKYRINAHPTFLTQYNVYQVQRKTLCFWQTIADYRSMDAALEAKRLLEAA